MARKYNAIGSDFANLTDGFKHGGGSAQVRYFQLSGGDVTVTAQQSIALTLPNQASDTLLGYKFFANKGDLLTATASGTPVVLPVGADGQFLVADSTQASGLGYKSADSMAYVSVAGTTHTAAPNQSLATKNSALTTITMPATCAEGALFEVIGVGTGGWTIQLNSGQRIVQGDAVTSLGGTFHTVRPRGVVQLRCVVANTEFQVVDSDGNFECL